MGGDDMYYHGEFPEWVAADGTKYPRIKMLPSLDFVGDYPEVVEHAVYVE